MASAQKPRPTNHFRLTVGGKEAIGQFREVAGLDSESEIVEQKEVDARATRSIIKVPGNLKWSNIELKRGIDIDKGLWEWRYQVETEGSRRARARTARSSCSTTTGRRSRRTTITQAWPSKYTGVSMNAGSNEVAVEAITHLPRGLQADVAMRTEFAFTLPRGYVDAAGTVHREGTMRLATARDEIEPLRDAQVRQNEAYLAVLLLAPRGHPDRGRRPRSRPSWWRSCTRRTSTTCSACTSASTRTARRWGRSPARTARSRSRSTSRR